MATFKILSFVQYRDLLEFIFKENGQAIFTIKEQEKLGSFKDFYNYTEED
jgi:hypothetical protein